MTTTTQETLDQLLERLGIHKYDFLLVGDGSGSQWGFECGWGCVSIDGSTFERRAWHGAMNTGTVNFAEMMAYLQPLCWYVNREMLNRKQPDYPVIVRHIHILTDSQYVKNKGSHKNMTSGPNSALWQIFKQFGSYGMKIHWHWIRRDTVDLNKYADLLSKAARVNLKGKDLSAKVSTESFDPPRSVYQINPSE